MDHGRELATAETQRGSPPRTGPTDGIDPLALTGATDELGSGGAVTLADGSRGGHGREAPPTRIDKYVVLERLGQGGMGTVYTVYNPDLDRRSVIKLVRPDQAGEAGQRRLLREARLLATLSHPNVVQVHDSGIHEGAVYVAMEYIAGVTFDAWRRSGPHPWRRVLEVHAQAGLGLAAAHARGIVHRDYTPRNAMLGDDGRAVVLDFGLSHDRVAVASPPRTSSSVARRPEDSLTQSGAIVGTPRYMSPEQLRGAPTDPRSDQFSFCVVLWEALLGRLPFSGDNIHVYNGAVLEGHVEAPDDLCGIPPTVVAALRRGLSPQPEQRFPDMRALLAALEPPAPRDRRGPLAALVVAALAVGLGLWRAASTPPSPAEQCAAETADVRLWEPTALAGLPPAARARLDALASAWLTARTDLCAAHRAGALPDALHRRGFACLAAHRAVLARVGEHLEGGAGGLDLAELPDPAGLAACADPWNMSQETEPTTPAGRAAAARIADALSRSRAALVVGSYGESEALAVAAVGAAREVGDDAALAAALFQLGRARTYGPRAAAAEPALREAATLAVAHDLHALAADATLRLVRVAALHGERPEDGRVWYAALVGHLARLGEREGPREAEAREYLGAIARREGDLVGARAEFERALTGRVGAWAFLRTPALIGLGRVALAEGDPAAARAGFAEAAQIVEAELGSHHPKLALPLLGLIEAELLQGRLDDAAATIARVGALLERADDPQRPVLDYYRARLAEQRGDLPTARDFAESARRGLRAAGLGLEIRGYAPWVLDLAGYTAWATGAERDALGPYIELLALGDQPRAAAATLRVSFGNAAEIAAGLGESALALRFVAAARSLPATAEPASARAFAADLALFEGQALLAAGRRAAATAALEEGLAAWDRSGGDLADPRAGALCFTLFTALRDDLPALARPYAERARTVLAGQMPSPRDRLDVVTSWLRAHPRRSKDDTRD